MLQKTVKLPINIGRQYTNMWEAAPYRQNIPC